MRSTRFMLVVAVDGRSVGAFGPASAPAEHLCAGGLQGNESANSFTGNGHANIYRGNGGNDNINGGAATTASAATQATTR